MGLVERGSAAMNVGVVMVLAMAFLLLSLSEAALYPVAWDFGNSENNWYPGKTFKIGDQLLFQYNNSEHNVIAVGIRVYASCGPIPSTPTYTSGNDTVTLTQAGDFYFICGLLNQCVAGMHLRVTVA